MDVHRERWEEFGQSATSSDVNQAAVCEVIAQHLWEVEERDEQDTKLPRQLKDRVSRMVAKKELSPETLRWMLESFDISPHDSERLYALYRGEIAPRAIEGELSPPSPDSGIRVLEHQTELLFEHHCLGESGLPIWHHTQQTIFSLVDGMESYQYRIDTAEADVRVRRGGTPGEIYSVGEGYYAIDIIFPRPLAYEEECDLDYFTRFHYSEPPPPEFRRGAHERVKHLDMRIQFHKRRLPHQLWWAEWQDYRDLRGGIIQRESVFLDGGQSASKYLDYIQQTVVGYYWEW
jgi:hypothetical protein